MELSPQWKAAEVQRHERKQFIRTLKQALDTWKQNRRAQADLENLLPRLERALAVTMEERRRFTDDLLAQISAEVGRMYEVVHPGEGLNRFSMELDAKKRASLELAASFGGQVTPPQAYFSDSHLETLGLCVFLALAALDEPEETILVLDDVMASVDEPHVERLIEMLSAEAFGFRHVIMTTHYRPWRDKFRSGWLRGSQCQFLELGPWSPQDGMACAIG
jgi:wobble nucleotide-excising tRNase